MEKYENLGMLGEGSYGMVMKCRHKVSGQAINRFRKDFLPSWILKVACLTE